MWRTSVSTATPALARLALVQPTCATSGSVYVHHGMTSAAQPAPAGQPKSAFWTTIRAAASAAWVNFQPRHTSPAA